MASDDLTKQLDNGALARILAEFAALRAEFAALRAEFKALDDKVEARLKDTRPIWEGVQSQLKELRGDMDGLRADIDGLRGDVDKGFRRLERRIGTHSIEISEMRTTQAEFDERLGLLEK